MLGYTGAILLNNILFQVLIGIFTGLIMCRMFVLYHDYHHGAILRNSRAAEFIMSLFGLFALAPPSIWKMSHDHHHDHNSKFTNVVVGGFPLMTKKGFIDASQSEKVKYLAFRHPLMIAFAYIPIFLISFCLYPFIESPRKHLDGLFSFLMHGLYLILLYQIGGTHVLLTAGLIPFSVVCMIGAYIFYVQHNCPDIKFNKNEEWDYVEAALKSSSYIQMSKLMSWVTANVGYHHIHHINSKIPFYRLPEAMNAMREFQSPAKTTLNIMDIKKCLELKFWDEDKKIMITRKGLTG